MRTRARLVIWPTAEPPSRPAVREASTRGNLIMVREHALDVIV
ncbi:hypothetical protein [Streptomyces sp. NPDC058735]